MRDRMDRIASTPNLCILSILFILSSPQHRVPRGCAKRLKIDRINKIYKM